MKRKLEKKTFELEVISKTSNLQRSFYLKINEAIQDSLHGPVILHCIKSKTNKQTKNSISIYFNVYKHLKLKINRCVTHLYPRFRKVNFHCHFFAHKDVRVARLGEQRLEHIELRAGERRPLTSLFPGGSCQDKYQRFCLD